MLAGISTQTHHAHYIMLHSYDFFGWLYLNVVICLIDYSIRKQKLVYVASASVCSMLLCSSTHPHTYECHVHSLSMYTFISHSLSMYIH